MVRSLVITMVLLCFSLIMTIVQTTGALPYANSQATSQWNSDAVNDMVISQNVSSSDNTGYIGAFNIQIKLVGQIFNIVLGTLVVAIPICNLFGWSPVIVMIAGAIQTVLYALIGFDLLVLWKGVNW